jgi:hypothetical protein
MVKVYDYNIAGLSAINVAETLKLASISLRTLLKRTGKGPGP